MRAQRLGAVPDEEPDVVLEYGDGSFLQLWSVKLVNSSTGREYGLFLRYVNQQGQSYAYDYRPDFLEQMTARLPAAERPWKNKLRCGNGERLCQICTKKYPGQSGGPAGGGG